MRPEYLYQPIQIWRRLRFRADGIADLRLPCGITVRVNTDEVIGRSLATLGAYDLPVAETIVRLLRPGESAVDVGANIGYTAALMAKRVGAQGRVVCVEPHPTLFQILQTNAQKWHAHGTLLQVAVSDESGTALLHVPTEFSANNGTAGLDGDSDVTIPVQTAPLDDLYPNDERIHLLKIDTEGHELNVLRGSSKLLSSKRVRDIIYEDHHGYPNGTSQLLEQHGYTVFRISRSFFRPRLLDPRSPARPNEPPNYLATTQPDRAVHAMFLPLWGCLLKTNLPRS